MSDSPVVSGRLGSHVAAITTNEGYSLAIVDKVVAAG